MLEKYFEKDTYLKLQASDDLLFKTLELVLKLFNSKLDKSNMPYLLHLMKVYEGVDDYLEKIVALLHDVLEDTEITSDDLIKFGYDEKIITMLIYLTKIKGEYYPDYIERIISSEDIHVLNVKLADLKHNMDITRIKNPSVNDYERITKRYEPAYNKIKNKIDELLKEKTNARY